ncbi:MFS transporter [Streptomyces sp. SID3343]|uniref:MFS transporter n=1 Tax=Streptomyces sp. SID3343 TaxID=2690260 RepID=UPI00136B7B74|nr:MFS transporter [Streptomyces sp. SID3343]MYV96874.1 MFS transporter [Streptomyces sp. SID3343]
MSTTARAPSSSRAVLLAMCACVTVAQSMVAAINLAIPQLAASHLHPSPSRILWIVDAYVIVFAGLLIPAGALGDRFGRKGALIGGLGVFAAGAVTSALAVNSAMLIAGRGISGAGAALIMPATMSILMHVFPPERRPQAMASWTLAVGLGGLLGNVGGGLVQEYLPWQGLFWAMVPLAVVLAILVQVVTPRTDTHPAALDPIGSALLIAGLVGVLYGIIEGPSLGWGSAEVIAGFALGVLLLAVFVLHALRVEHPLLDPRVFASPRLRAGVLGIGASFFGLFALFFVNAQYLQYVKGFSAMRSGFAIVPLTVGMALAPKVAVKLQQRYGTRSVVVGGLSLIGIGLLCMATVDAGTSYVVYAGYLLILSVGMGLSAPALSFGVVSELPRHRAGMGSGLNTAAREIGAALGVAVFGTILATRFSGEPAAELGRARGAEHARVVESFTDAMSVGFTVVGATLLLATVAVAVGYRNRPAPAAAEPAAQPVKEPVA